MRRWVVMGVVCALVATSFQPGRSAGVEPRRAQRERSFRLFAMGYKQTMRKARTYRTFRSSLRRRFEQIRPLFAERRPNVVFFPEATALTAWLIGPRGRQARRRENTAVSAVASLAATYAPQVSYYEAKCRVPPSRALVLALTDTTWRAFGESLMRLSHRHRVHVVASANIGRVRKVTEPGKVALLADPQKADQGYAYEAVCDKAFNTAFFFGPRGRMFTPRGRLRVGRRAAIRGIVPKAYLVPIERDQAAGLALSSASPARVRPVDLGFASFGVFTSKDAWMSDLPNRNDVDGADVFLQPEAGPWAGWSEAGVRHWQQDAMHRAVWGFVQKLPVTRWGALSNLIGNFHDLPFDGTPTITTDASSFPAPGRGRRNRRHFLLGRGITGGIVARSHWVVRDPGPGIPFRDRMARRRFLQRAGAKRAPGSGSPKENAYRNLSFVWADVTLPPRTRPMRRVRLRPFSRSRAITRARGPQWEPDLAVTRGGTLLAAWTDLSHGDEDAVVSRRARRRWTTPVNAGPSGRRPDDQQDNQYGVTLAVGRGRVHAVWADFRNQSWDVRAPSSRLRRLRFSPDVRVDHSRTSGEGYPRENLHNDPAVITTRSGVAVAAWDDLRRTRAHRDIRVASLARGQRRWRGDSRPARSSRGEQFHPALAAGPGERVWAVWQDHRGGDADIRMAVSRRGRPRSLRGTLRVDDGPGRSDAFHPQIAFSGGRAVVAWSDDRSGRYQVRVALVRRRGASPSIRIAAARGDQTYPAITRAGRRRWFVAWTDARAGDQDVVGVALRRTRRGLVASRPLRLDDSGAADARLPAVAFDGRKVWAAWEDKVGGVERIRYSSAPAHKLF